KTPDFIKVVRPIVSGVISDFDAEVFLLQKFLERSVYLYTGNKTIKPMMIGIATVPTIATEIEQKAVREALLKIGMSQVFLVEKPLATAAGASINIFSNEPTLIADLGGGLIELSIVGSSGILSQKTLKNAGDQMNKVIFNYIYLKYGIILGEATCEHLKIEILNFKNTEKIVVTRGKSLENGLPKSVKIKSSDINEALRSNFNQIIDGIKELMESSPPEVVDEVMQKGVILTGGLSRIEGIDKFFEEELKVNVSCSDKYEYSTINGLMKLTINEEAFSKILIQ
ncbi:MAG: rod shape-determining protein, partial [Patescibacteria group bacterium]